MSDDPAAGRLPVFVYGTLRSGERNASMLRGRVVSRRRATLSGFRLLDNGAFPYLVPGDHPHRVTGDVVDLDPGRFTECLADLDRLEGVEWGHYTRELVEVESVQGPEMVWTYVAGPAVEPDLASLPVIESGDWLDR